MLRMFSKAIIYFYTILLLLAILSCTSSKEDDFIPEEEDAVEEMSVQDKILLDAGKVWIDKLCCEDFAGRRVGTEGNRLAFEYICQELDKMGYTPESQIFSIENGTILRNIIVAVPGQSDSTIIVGAHFDGAKQSTDDNHFQAANDNGSGVVALLLLLKYLKEESKELDKSMICCFWDGEESFERKVFRGSTFYAKQLTEPFKSLVLYYVNLDTVGHDHDYDNNGLGDINIDCFGSDLVSRISTMTANNGRFDYSVFPRKTASSDYASFDRIGIPFIWYHDHNSFSCSHPIHSTADIKDVISIKRLIKIAKNVCDYLDSYNDL